MRSAGCIINDIADRNIDTRVKRTKQRPLAAKRIHSRSHCRHAYASDHVPSFSFTT